MAYKKPANLFEAFERWHPLFNQCQTTKATIDDQFEPEKHRSAAVHAWEETAGETGYDLTDVQKSEFMQTADEATVKSHVVPNHAIFGRRLNGIIENQFDDLWEATPDAAKRDLYSLITQFKPKSNLTGLSDEFEKGLKQHKFLSKVGGKLGEYQSRNITESRRNELEKEFLDMYNEEIDKAYLDTPEKETEYKELAKAMKIWAKKSSKMVLRRLAEKQEKAIEKFNESIRLITEEGEGEEPDKPANFREYMRTVLDSKEQRSLYGTAVLYHKHTQREDKLKSASDYPMAV